MARFASTSLRRLAAAAVCITLSAIAIAGDAGIEPLPLEDILERLARSAVSAREVALKFTCDEKISWTPFLKRGSVRFNYVFEFGKGYGFSNYRTHPGTQAPGKPPREVTPEQADVPAYLGSAYLWIFSFRAERQSRHKYDLVDTIQLDGHPAAVVSFEPRLPIVVGVNDWFGTAWVDLDTAQLLKVEAYSPSDWAEMEKMKHHLTQSEGSASRYKVQRITTIFSVEAHGMRFPGRVELRNEEHHLAWRAGRWNTWKSTLLRVDQEYTGYEFFGVVSSVRRSRPK